MTRRRTPPARGGVIWRALADYSCYSLRASCDKCGHHKRVDFQQLIRRYGPDYEFSKIKPRLVCTICNNRRCTMFLSHNGTPSAEYAGNRSAAEHARQSCCPDESAGRGSGAGASDRSTPLRDAERPNVS